MIFFVHWSGIMSVKTDLSKMYVALPRLVLF
jgi:hypothetical protein